MQLDTALDAREILQRLNTQAPRQMRFLRAEELSSKRAPQPTRTHYELVVPLEKLREVCQRLKELEELPDWPIERSCFRRNKATTFRTIDLRPLVERLRLHENVLKIVLVRRGDLWARPAEVLVLLGLDGRTDLARLVRTEVQWDPLTDSTLRRNENESEST